jgi:hypothetical protein
MKLPARWLTIAAFTVLAIGPPLPVATVTASSQPVAPQGRYATLVNIDCHVAGTQPPVIVLDCPYGGVLATHLHWGTWGKDRARGHGQLEANDCRPDCAYGDRKIYPIHIKLRHPRLCAKDGVDEFQRAVVTFGDAKPKWANQTQVWTHLGCRPRLEPH